MRLGVIFPNESSFYQKMGAEIFENDPQVRKLYQKMSKVAQLDLKKSLIYEQTETNWDGTNRRIAVLLTSVVFYRRYVQCYQIKPTALIGSGVGVLSALVCDETLPLRYAIRMIRTKNWKLPTFKQPSGNVFACAQRITDRTQVEKLSDVPCENEIESILQCVQEEKLDRVIEIGPNCCLTPSLRKAAKEGTTLFAYLDDANDNGFILENFEYQKHFNNLYAARRVLAMAAATQNYGADNAEEIVAAFNAIKAYVDEVQKKRFTGTQVHVSEYDLRLCIDQLKLILRYKSTPKEEIQARVLALENELAIPLRTYFAQWMGGLSDA